MARTAKEHGIAEWRIDSEEERTLASKADESEEWKQRYVDFYREADPKYFEKGLDLIEKHIALFVHEELTEEQHCLLVRDMVYSLHRFGCMFDEYFLFNYRYLNVAGRESFITDKIRYDFYDRLSDPSNQIIFDDKSKTYELFGEYYKRDFLPVRSDSDFDAFLQFSEKHPRFLVKPFDATIGRGVRIIETDSDDMRRGVFEELLESGGMICEELIIQAPEMAVLHPQSVNTIRVPTVRCSDGARVIGAFVRMGRRGSIVDNAGAGGIFANIDPATGIVYTGGVDEFGGRYLTHPETGVVIPGFQVPKWDEVLDLVNILSRVLPTSRYVGWDLALTADGWIVVEGNARGQFVCQMVDAHGVRKELEELIAAC